MKMALFADNFVAPLSAALNYWWVNSAPPKAARRIPGKNFSFSLKSNGN
jgi:hypothetical protein